MDTSETYIKMSDNDLVQSLAELLSLETKQCSHFVKADDHKTIIWASNMIVTPPAIKFIRLFRQDQLQEMLDEKIAWVLAKDFAAKVYHLSSDTGMSMEQLWLAFVMSERYQKIWDGTDWIKDKA